MKNPIETGMHTFIGQILIYIPGLIIPALINFLSLVLYTRILTADAYGRYAILLAAVVTVKMVLFEWLRLGVLRFFQSEQHAGNLNAFISTALAGYVITAFIVAIIGWGLLQAFPSMQIQVNNGFLLALLWLLGWALFELILQMNRAALASKRYGILSAEKAVLGLIASLLLLVSFEKSERAIILGLLFGIGVTLLIDLPKWLKWVRGKCIDVRIASTLVRYGMPFTVTLALDSVISLSDRFLLNYYMDSNAVGVYAASYDLTNQSVMIIFTILNLAVYPILLKTLESKGRAQTLDQLRNYAVILFAITVPSCIGMALISEPLANVFLGEAFRQVAYKNIPWIAMATFFMGAKAFYADLSFQFGLRSDLQIWPVAAAALLNILLNLWWIPISGVVGAAKATCVAYLFAMVLSIVMGRRLFMLPFPLSEIFQISSATFVMAVILVLIPKVFPDWGQLAIMLCVGVSVYMMLVWIMDVAEIRIKIRTHLHLISGIFIKTSSHNANRL